MRRNRESGRARRSAVTLLILFSTATAPSFAEEGKIGALLRRQTQELMDAVAPGRVEVWKRYLHEKFVSLDENGVVADKATMLRELTPLPPGLVGRIAVDKFQTTLLGDTAVAAGEIQESLDYHGQQLHTRFRFLDTWTRTAEGWRLLGHHVEAVLKDPPAIPMPPSELCAYAGVYRLTAEIVTTVRCVENGLLSERSGRPAATFLPELRDLFFEAGKPRVRRIFLRDQAGAAGSVVAFVDRREGEDIRWDRVASPPR